MTREDDSEGSVDLLVDKLRWLRLPGMARLVPSLLDQAGKDNLTSLAILHRLADGERASRLKSAIDRRIKDARFPEVNTFDGFDFDAARKKLRARYLALHDLGFLSKGINPLFLGVPGTGKTFLARARVSCLPGCSPRRRHQRHTHAQRARRHRAPRPA